MQQTSALDIQSQATSCLSTQLAVYNALDEACSQITYQLQAYEQQHSLTAVFAVLSRCIDL